MLTIGSLFSGIGGLELGLEMAGLGPVLWQVEKAPFPRAVLAKHWPYATRYDDVCSLDCSNLAPVDLICGGFPCQDVSPAGTRKGLTGERSGLWREFARIVDGKRPAWVVVENVAGGASRWFDQVVGELDGLGYECLPVPVSARDVGAPHLRERIFIVAHALDQSGALQSTARRGVSGAAPNAHGLVGESRRSTGERDAAPLAVAGRDSAVVCGKCCRVLVKEGLATSGSLCSACAFERDFADADDPRREGAGPGEEIQNRPGLTRHVGWASEPGVVPLVHGLSGGLAGRRRRARIRALGNTVVPQCSEVAGWVIRELMMNEGGTEGRS